MLSFSVVIETGFLTGRIHPGTTIFIIAYINRGPKGLKTKNIEDNITFWISCFNSKSQGTKKVSIYGFYIDSEIIETFSLRSILVVHTIFNTQITV